MEWIRSTELAKIKGVSDRAIRKAITSGKYKAQKVCQRYEIFVASLEPEVQEKISNIFPNETIDEKFDIPISEMNKKRALTKFDIVMKWRNFCVNYKGKKVDALKEFTTIYNTLGKKEVSYGSLNKLGLSTIMRWDKTLRESSDNWKALVPKYKSNPQKAWFSEKEKETFLKILLNPNQPNIGKAIKLTKHILSQQGVQILQVK